MSERYVRLFICDVPQVQKGAPVLLAAGVLLGDRESGRVLAQIKLQNISEKTIKAVYVRIQCMDAMNVALSEQAEAKYLDLNAGFGSFFGDRQPILLNDASIRSFTLRVTDVMFADGTAWHSANDETCLNIPAIPSTLNKEQLEQLSVETHLHCTTSLADWSDVKRCVCGQWNMEGNKVCVRCKLNFEKLATVATPKHLDANYAARKKQEAEEAEAAIQQAKTREEEQKRLQEQQALRDARRKKIIAILSITAIAIVLLVTQVIIPSNNYNNAISLRASGQYEEAIVAFTELGGYNNAADQIAETYYQQALALTAAQDYAGAAAIFTKITGYKDVDTLLETDENLKTAARDAKFTVGNYVEFGTYPQTAVGTDNTPIEWLVLARDGNKALLISRYGLDAQPYDAEYTDVTWETCTLRTWLNSTFMNKAFTAEEQKAILTTSVINSSSQCYSGWSTNGGNNTQDQIFLLSYAEANKYFDVTHSYSNRGYSHDTKARVKPTAYAEKRDAFSSSVFKTEDGDNAGRWWLRSPGGTQGYVTIVNDDGSCCNLSVHADDGCVRPALWVNLELFPQ